MASKRQDDRIMCLTGLFYDKLLCHIVFLSFKLLLSSFHDLIPDLLELKIGLGGLGVTCSPRDPRFEGSNPAEVDGFFQDVKILSTSPPGGTSIWGSRV